MEDAAVSRTVELIFGVLDADGNGTVDGQELLGMISAIHFKPSPALLQHLTENW
jgi:Ca2+-binding EF-hand superfamily protein